MQRFWLTVLISVLMILAIVPISGCNNNDNDESLETTTPQSTLEVTPTASPEAEEQIPMRIISLAPSNTEILFALGLGNKVVGVTGHCDYPPEAAEKAIIGGFSTPDLEKILELEPDLVLATSKHEEEIIPALESRGLKVLTLAPKTLEEVLESILKVGTETREEDKAALLVADMQQKIDAIADKVISLTEDEKPYVFYVTWNDPIWTVGNGTFIHEQVQTAGGRNIFADSEGHLQTNLETIIDRNPQVILASSGHGAAEDSPISWINTEERLIGVEARINETVYEVDANMISRAGPRIVDGLRIIAECIHPELFSE